MNDTNFNVGDKVFHKSDSTVVWIIEKIENNEAFCSTLIKETLEQKKQKFTLTSIEKCAIDQIRFGSNKKRNNYW